MWALNTFKAALMIHWTVKLNRNDLKLVKKVIKYNWTKIIWKGGSFFIQIIVVDVNDSLLSKQFSKQGCSRGLRAKLWSQILNVHQNLFDVVYYNSLKQSVLEYDLLIDSIYYKVKLIHKLHKLLYCILINFASRKRTSSR